MSPLDQASRRSRLAALAEGRTLEHRHGRRRHDHDLGYLHHAHHRRGWQQPSRWDHQQEHHR